MKDKMDAQADHKVKIKITSVGKKQEVRVAPPRIHAKPGQRVRFENVTGDALTLMFPLPWFEGPMTVPVAADQTHVEIDIKQKPNRDDCGKDVPYQIYCLATNDYAVGESPPKMKVDPPPDQRGP